MKFISFIGKITFVILCGIGNLCAAQDGLDSLLNKEYNTRLGIIERLRLVEMGNYARRGDTALFRQKVNHVITTAEKNKDNELLLEMQFLNLGLDWFLYGKTDSIIIKTNLLNLKEKAEKHNYEKLTARILLFLGQYTWEQLGNYEKSMEYFWELEKTISQISPENYYDKATCFYFIGEKHYHFTDYSKAIKYLKEVISVPEHFNNTNYFNNAINLIGLCYQQLKKYDSSNYYFNLLASKEFKFGAALWKDVATGNLGNNFYFQKNYTEALPLILQGFDAATQRNDPYYASGAATRLADIYTRLGNLKLAEQYIKEAQKYIQLGEKYERYAQLYPVMAQWYILQGNQPAAFHFMDSAMHAINDNHIKYNAIQLHKAEQRIQIMEQEAQRIKFDARRQKDINRRNTVIFSLLAFMFILTTGYYLYRRKTKERLQIQTLKLQQTQQELTDAQQQLLNFKNSIVEKNKIFENLEDKYVSADSSSLFFELKNSVILTDTDWQNFQDIFEKAYPGILPQLNHNYPNLTAAELRYILLSFLNFSHKEMAGALGISPNSLRVTWHRLRKKLALDPSATIQDFMAQV